MNQTPLILFCGEAGGVGRADQRFRQMKSMYSVVSAPTYVEGKVRPSLVSRVRHRLGLVPDTTDVNARVIEALVKKPHVIWVEKGLSVRGSTLKRVRRDSPTTQICLWLEEYIDYRTNHSWPLWQALPHYHWVFTPRQANLGSRWLKKRQPGRVVLVDDTYDEHEHQPLVPPPPPGIDVGFIGSYEEPRARSMLALAQAGIVVNIWGAMWDRCRFQHPNLIIHCDVILGRAYSLALQSTRINLCFLRKHNRDQHTNRTMEIPACGGFMLAERTADHLRQFREGEEAAFFTTDEELIAKARFYLDNEERRRQVALQGRQRVVASHNSHRERIEYLVAVALGRTQPKGPPGYLG